MGCTKPLRAFAYFHFDVEVGFYQSYPAEALVREAATVEGVTGVEPWGAARARTEGLLIGLLSWLGGSILGYPLSQLLSNLIGMAFLKSPFAFSFPIYGVLIWLLLSLVIAGGASLWPALRAAEMRVVEVLQEG